MNRIFTVSEAVLDLIFSQGQPEACRPGGALLNTAVSLGRLRMGPWLISELAEDRVGKQILSFLESNAIHTDLVYRFHDGQTPLALAFLDSNRNAEYSFYRNFPAQRFQIPDINFLPDDILMFGSYFSISPDLRPMVKSLLKKAHEAGVVLFYDPNFRKAHLQELPTLIESVKENLQMAHLVRGSDEDFATLFGASDGMEAHRHCPQAILFYTMGSKGCLMITPEGQSHYWPAEPIESVSTIGAGDTFNAGLAYGIWTENLSFNTVHNPACSVWDSIVTRALKMAASVCQSYDNYIDTNLADQIYDGTED